MDKYSEYLSNVGRDLDRSIQEPFRYPDKRIGKTSPSERSDSVKTDSYQVARTWDQMSHEQRNKYLYG